MLVVAVVIVHAVKEPQTLFDSFLSVLALDSRLLIVGLSLQTTATPSTSVRTLRC